eukprot:3404847-Amphidinium_carterae.1
MDDYEHRGSTDYLSPSFPISQSTVPEQRIRRAGHWMDLSYDEVDTALEYAQVLVDEGRVQYQERVLQFPQETVNDEFVYFLGTSEEARVEHNQQAENAQRGLVLHPTWRGIDQHGATVQIYPPRDMPGNPGWADVANETTRLEELEAAANDLLLNHLTPNSAPSTPASHAI